MIPYFLERLKNTRDGDSHLENTRLLYGSRTSRASATARARWI
jgi:hypothetical protein